MTNNYMQRPCYIVAYAIWYDEQDVGLMDRNDWTVSIVETKDYEEFKKDKHATKIIFEGSKLECDNWIDKNVKFYNQASCKW